MTRVFSTLALTLALAASTLSAAQDTKVNLTKDNLKTTLTNMGLKPVEVYKGKYSIVINRDGYNVPAQIDISPSGGFVHLTAERKFNRPGELPESFWKGLLVHNETASPKAMFWAFNPVDRKLELRHYARTGGVNAAELRKILNAFHAEAKAAKDIWAMKEAEVAPIVDTAEQARERAALKGRWQATKVINMGKELTDAEIKKMVQNKPIEITLDKMGELVMGTAQKTMTRMGPKSGQLSLYVGADKVLIRCCYKLENDTLTLCLDGIEYPKDCTSTAANGRVTLVMKKVK